MNPISVTPDAAPEFLGDARDRDFASRLAARGWALRARAESRDALLDALRQANATIEPAKVARWLLAQAQEWVDAPCWVVVAHDVQGKLAVIADQGLTPACGPSLWSTTAWVMNNGVELFAADLAGDGRAGPGAAGTAIGFPLVCRGRTVGVLVGLDPVPSTATPALDATLLSSLRGLLEPVAIALGNALALEKAEALSVTDDLTRVYNSRYLNQVLRRETKRASRSGRPLSLLFADLDGFKQVNDSYGHLAGSKALVEAAAVFRGCARETDVVARFGGDEFAVVLPDTGRDGAAAVAIRVLDRLRAFEFLVPDGLSVHLTASIGVATLPDVANSAEELIRAADAAMYRVKAAGKDGIATAQQDDSADSSLLRLKE